MKNHMGEAFALVIYLAMIFTLVRPNSQGPQLVKNFGSSLATVVQSATGGGSFNP
jgi:hypothetical protein